MKEKIASIGSVFSAALASICCIGPLVFVALGVTSAAWAASLITYRPLFIGLTAVLLGVGFYYNYGRQGKACAPGSVCAVGKGGRLNRIILWSATVLSIGLLLFPYIP